MEKYISLDALVAEIERRQGVLDLDNPLGRGGMVELECLKNSLNTLEVKEVDLDFTKEVDVWVRDNGDTNGFFNVQDLAKHFFELGLKAQKGEKV